MGTWTTSDSVYEILTLFPPPKRVQSNSLTDKIGNSPNTLASLRCFSMVRESYEFVKFSSFELIKACGFPVIYIKAYTNLHRTGAFWLEFCYRNARIALIKICHDYYFSGSSRILVIHNISMDGGSATAPCPNTRIRP